MASFFSKLWPFGRKNKNPQVTPPPKEEIEFDNIDIKALMGQAPDDVINRFLNCTDLKITVDDSTKGDEEIVTEPKFEDEDDIVSEELAKIYLSQGLNSEAIEIYRKLSLLNSEKSVYFAKLIALIENK